MTATASIPIHTSKDSQNSVTHQKDAAAKTGQKVLNHQMPLFWVGCHFDTIHATLNRNEPFVLPSRHYHHVRELLERSLDLRHTLINIMQLYAHAVISTRPCDDDTERRQNVAVVDRGVKQRLGLFGGVLVIHGNSLPIILPDQCLKIRATFSIDRPPTYAVTIMPIQSATMPVMGSVVPRPKYPFRAGCGAIF
jgi:hypothetical protein